MPLRDIAGKLGGPWATAPLGLLSMTWQLAHHWRASCAPFWTSARTGCAATRASANSTSMAGKALYNTFATRPRRSALRWWLKGGGELFCRVAELRAMRFVERIARGQRSGELGEDAREEPIVQMNHGLTPIFTRPHQSNGDAVRIGIGVELRVPAKTAHVRFVREIDRDLGLVGNRMQ